MPLQAVRSRRLPQAGQGTSASRLTSSFPCGNVNVQKGSSPHELKVQNINNKHTCAKQNEKELQTPPHPHNKNNLMSDPAKHVRCRQERQDLGTNRSVFNECFR